MLRVDRCRLEYTDFSALYSLEVPMGSLCAVVGPSGGGKTTLLHLIAGFEQQSSGSLCFEGRELTPLKPSERPIAMVFQEHNLFPHLTTLQNVGLGVRPSLRLGADERQRVSDALEAVELDQLADRRPGEMSGGQRQRVALARALVTRKPLLLLDEPFGGLDPGLRRSMIRLVDGLGRSRGITVVSPFIRRGHCRGRGPGRLRRGGRGDRRRCAPSVLTPARDRRIAMFLG